MTAKVQVESIDPQRPFAVCSTVCKDSKGTVLMTGTVTVKLPKATKIIREGVAA
jgi:hypothetical protein